MLQNEITAVLDGYNNSESEEHTSSIPCTDTRSLIQSLQQTHRFATCHERACHHLAPWMCYICNRWTCRHHIVRDEGEGSHGRRYIVCSCCDESDNDGCTDTLLSAQSFSRPARYFESVTKNRYGYNLSFMSVSSHRRRPLLGLVSDLKILSVPVLETDAHKAITQLADRQP